MLVERTRQLKVGPDNDDDLGPVINDKQLNSMLAAIEQAPELNDGDSNYQERKPQMNISVDRDRSATLGVSLAAIAKNRNLLPFEQTKVCIFVIINVSQNNSPSN